MIYLILILLLVHLVLLHKTLLTQKTNFPRKIFQTWKNKNPPPQMEYWSSTWKKYNPDYEHVLWDDSENRKFIQEKYPWFLETYDGYDREIKRADAVRYFYLYTYGGIYADMDFECLKSITPLLHKFESNFGVLLGTIDTKGKNIDHSIPNAIMISKPGEHFWINVFKELVLRANKTTLSVEEMTGPVMLKHVYNKYYFQGFFGRSNICLLMSNVLYPISWITQQEERQEALQLSRRNDFENLSNLVKKRYPSSYTATYWTHSW